MKIKVLEFIIRLEKKLIFVEFQEPWIYVQEICLITLKFGEYLLYEKVASGCSNLKYTTILFSVYEQVVKVEFIVKVEAT